MRRNQKLSLVDPSHRQNCFDQPFSFRPATNQMISDISDYVSVPQIPHFLRGGAAAPLMTCNLRTHGKSSTL